MLPDGKTDSQLLVCYLMLTKSNGNPHKQTGISHNLSQLNTSSPSLQAAADKRYLLTRNQWVQKVPAMQLPPESHRRDPKPVELPTFNQTKDQKQTDQIPQYCFSQKGKTQLSMILPKFAVNQVGTISICENIPNAYKLDKHPLEE